MSDAVRPTFPMILRKSQDEFETVELRFGWREAEWFERNAGVALFPAITEKFGLITATWMILAGMRHANQKLEYEDVRARLERHLDNGGSFPDLSVQLIQALRSFGLLKRQPGDEDAPARPLPVAPPRLVSGEGGNG